MPLPIVTLDRVHVALGGAPVLQDVSLELREGEGLAVLGGNGSGKSTLLRLLRGDLWPAPGSPGRRLFHGPGGPSESPIGVRERLALVAPEAHDEYVRRDWDLPVEAVIRSGFSDAVWPAAAATPAQARAVAGIAEALGLAHLLRRSLLALSRGEGRRVLLARALVARPRALLLDEACDGLDARARAAFLARVAAAIRGGTAVVMATHRADELVPGLRRVVRLEGGRIVAEEAGPRRRAAAEAAQPGEARATPAPAPSPDLRAARPALFTLSRVTVLRHGRAVLAELDWTIRAGERWGVVGENGAGKSTLLRLLAGEEQPARGRVERLDLGPRAAAEALRARVGMVSPELQARHRLDASGEEVILSGFAGSIGLAVPPTDAQRAAARAAAERLGIAALLGRRIHALSYGELRKVLLARALAPAPEALLLDEPLAGLEPAARAWVLAAVDALGPEGPAVVAVSHHPDELPRGGPRLRLAGGRLA